MLGKRLINSNDAAAGGACTTNTNDYPTTNVAYYKMSSAADEKGTYNGTPSNVNFNVQGKFGNAAEFNGTNSYISLPPGVRQNNNFTASLWFNTNTISAAINLIAFRNGKKFQVQLNGAVGNGGIRVNAGNNTTVDSASGIVTVNNWNHLAVVQSSTTGLTVYLNNSIISSNSGATGDLVTVTGIDSIGSYEGTLNFMDGSIDQVRIFSSALNATQVASLYNEVYCVPTIVPNENFNTVVWSADGTSGDIDINGVGFKPDFVWAKVRTQPYSHNLFDSVRGVGSTHMLFSDSTNSESTNTANSSGNGFVSSFNTDGFTGATGTSANSYFNLTGNNYVSWNWKAGGAAVSNTDGTITSQVSANVDAGFSIVKYTGNNSSSATIGHGLGKMPAMVITKMSEQSGGASSTSQWMIYHKDLTGNVSGDNPYNLYFSAGTEFDLTAFGAYDNITTDVIPITRTSVSTAHNNNNLSTYVAYCFSEVDGYSKIGSYKGTGASGNTIVTGFRPAFVMVKQTSNIGSDNHWNMWDNKRVQYDMLRANTSSSEFAGTLTRINFLSNGFKMMDNDTSRNASGATYIFMAFAEEGLPYVTRNATNPFGDSSELALYKFEDDANDAEGNYNGTASNVTYASGYIDKAAVFTNTSYINGTSLTTGLPLTFSFWVKPTSTANAVGRLISKRSSSTTGFTITGSYSSSLGYPIMGFLNGGSYAGGSSGIATNKLTVGVWSNVVVVVETTGWTSYIDGVLNANNTGSITSNSIAVDFGNVFSIGNWVGSDWTLDQVRIFNRALDSGEVTALYNE